MGHVIAVRHIHFEDCGTLGSVLAERGHRVSYLDAPVFDLRNVDVATPDLVVFLGGPIGVYEEDKYPFLTDEIALAERRLRTNRPMLGICLGSQLIAKALGARVFPNPVKELGWKPLQLTSSGESSVVVGLGGLRTSMLHWHGDTFDLPAGAELLASTPECAHQIYSVGERCLAFQCHPEVDPDEIERWLVGHACEIAATAKVTVQQLRDDTRRFGAALVTQARKSFVAWLERQGL